MLNLCGQLFTLQCDLTGWEIDSKCWVKKVLRKESELSLPKQMVPSSRVYVFWLTMMLEKKAAHPHNYLECKNSDFLNGHQ